MKNEILEQLYKYYYGNTILPEMQILHFISILTTLEVTPNSVPTTYHMTCHHGFVDIFKELVKVWEIENSDTFFDMNQKDTTDSTLLQYATRNRKQPMVRYLIQNGAVYYINHAADYVFLSEDTSTTLMVAAQDVDNVKKNNSETLKPFFDNVTDVSDVVSKFMYGQKSIVTSDEMKQELKKLLEQDENKQQKLQAGT
jgi:hypothetical protein